MISLDGGSQSEPENPLLSRQMFQLAILIIHYLEAGAAMHRAKESQLKPWWGHNRRLTVCNFWVLEITFLYMTDA